MKSSTMYVISGTLAVALLSVFVYRTQPALVWVAAGIIAVSWVVVAVTAWIKSVKRL